MTPLQNQKLRRFSFLLPPFLWALVIFVASSIPSSEMPEAKILKYDKLIHLSVYFIFAFLIYRALKYEGLSAKVRSSASVLTVLLAAFYGATDEFHQFFVPGRSMDVFDWLADTSGAILAVALAAYLARRKPKTPGAS
jgi:VanZ family protein